MARRGRGDGDDLRPGHARRASWWIAVMNPEPTRPTRTVSIVASSPRAAGMFVVLTLAVQVWASGPDVLRRSRYDQMIRRAPKAAPGQEPVPLIEIGEQQGVHPDGSAKIR